MFTKGGYNQPAALVYLKYIDVVLAKPAAEQQPLKTIYMVHITM